MMICLLFATFDAGHFPIAVSTKFGQVRHWKQPNALPANMQNSEPADRILCCSFITLKCDLNAGQIKKFKEIAFRFSKSD